MKEWYSSDVQNGWVLYLRCDAIALAVLDTASRSAANGSCIQTRHLAASLFSEVPNLTDTLSLSPTQVHSILTEFSTLPLERYHPPLPSTVDLYKLSNECKRVFAYGCEEASKRSPPFTLWTMSAQDILIGLLTERTLSICRVLQKYGLDVDRVRRAPC
jgi:hypothetical protein